MGRPDPNARALAKAKQAEVPLDMSTMDPEMRSTLGGEQSRVFKNRMVYGASQGSSPASAIAQGWSNLVKRFNGTSKKTK